MPAPLVAINVLLLLLMVLRNVTSARLDSNLWTHKENWMVNATNANMYLVVNTTAVSVLKENAQNARLNPSLEMENASRSVCVIRLWRLNLVLSRLENVNSALQTLLVHSTKVVPNVHQLLSNLQKLIKLIFKRSVVVSAWMDTNLRRRPIKMDKMLVVA